MKNFRIACLSITSLIFLSQFSKAQIGPPSLTVGASEVLYQQGKLDAELIASIISNKQDEIKRELATRWIMESLKEESYLVNHFVDKNLNILFNQTNKQIIKKEILRNSTEFMLVLASLEFYLQHHVSKFDNQKDYRFVKRINKVITAFENFSNDTAFVKSDTLNGSGSGRNSSEKGTDQYFFSKPKYVYYLKQKGPIEFQIYDNSEKPKIEEVRTLYLSNILLDMVYNMMINSRYTQGLGLFRSDTTNQLRKYVDDYQFLMENKKDPRLRELSVQVDLLRIQMNKYFEFLAKNAFLLTQINENELKGISFSKVIKESVHDDFINRLDNYDSVRIATEKRIDKYFKNYKTNLDLKNMSLDNISLTYNKIHKQYEEIKKYIGEEVKNESKVMWNEDNNQKKGILDINSYVKKLSLSLEEISMCIDKLKSELDTYSIKKRSLIKHIESPSESKHRSDSDLDDEEYLNVLAIINSISSQIENFDRLSLNLNYQRSKLLLMAAKHLEDDILKKAAEKRKENVSNSVSETQNSSADNLHSQNQEGTKQNNKLSNGNSQTETERKLKVDFKTLSSKELIAEFKVYYEILLDVKKEIENSLIQTKPENFSSSDIKVDLFLEEKEFEFVVSQIDKIKSSFLKNKGVLLRTNLTNSLERLGESLKHLKYSEDVCKSCDREIFIALNNMVTQKKNLDDFAEDNWYYELKRNIIPKLIMTTISKSNMSDSLLVNTREVMEAIRAIKLSKLQSDRLDLTSKKDKFDLLQDFDLIQETYLRLIEITQNLDKIESYEQILKYIQEAGELSSNPNVARTINTIINIGDKYTVFNKDSNYIEIDVEAAYVDVFKHYAEKSSSTISMYFSVGINYNIPFEDEVKNFTDDSTKSFIFASEKLGVKFKLCDWGKKHSLNERKSKSYGQAIRNLKRPVINDLHLLLYGSGLLYQIEGLNSNKEFKDPQIGLGLGVSFFNDLDFGINYAITSAEHFNSGMLNVSFDIKITEYLAELNKKRAMKKMSN